MSRSDAARTEENKPMLKWLVLPMVVLAYLAATVSAGAPRDRDHDRLPDRWERKHHLSTTTPSAKRDPDRDRLKNRRELRLRTHPRRADTDRDRLRDGAEVRRFHTNPRKRDTDRDGFSDRCELRKGTNPRKRRSRPKRRCSKSPQRSPRHLAPAPPGGSPKPTGGWPDATNTGVPAGTVLTPSGSITVHTAGAVVDAMDVTGGITVNAPNVTIRRTRIQSNDFMAIRSNSTGLVVEDSEILDAPGGTANCHNGIGFDGFTIHRSEITGCENAADMGNATFTDNYVHDLDVTGPSHVWGNSPHTDGIQVGGSNVQILRNDISPQDEGTPQSTAAIIMNTGSTPNSNVRIEDNRLDGSRASYALYAPRSQTHDVYINRNRMLRGFGYSACIRLGVTVTECNDNRDAITGALIAPDNGVGGGCTN
jgi:Bacterial TSP3 repeat